LKNSCLEAIGGLAKPKAVFVAFFGAYAGLASVLNGLRPDRQPFMERSDSMTDIGDKAQPLLPLRDEPVT
jgi:hypothetical protein